MGFLAIKRGQQLQASFHAHARPRPRSTKARGPVQAQAPLSRPTQTRIPRVKIVETRTPCITCRCNSVFALCHGKLLCGYQIITRWWQIIPRRQYCGCRSTACSHETGAGSEVERARSEPIANIKPQKHIAAQCGYAECSTKFLSGEHVVNPERTDRAVAAIIGKDTQTDTCVDRLSNPEAEADTQPDCGVSRCWSDNGERQRAS